MEIGGYVPEVFCNVVPGERISTWEKACKFIVELASRGPRLELGNVHVERLAEELYRVSCRVMNEGYQPTHVTTLGAGLSHVDAVRVEMDRPDCVQFLAGRNKAELGHLKPSEYRALDWVLKAPSGTAITLVAHAPRAGRASVEVTLEG